MRVFHSLLVFHIPISFSISIPVPISFSSPIPIPIAFSFSIPIIFSFARQHARHAPECDPGAYNRRWQAVGAQVLRAQVLGAHARSPQPPRLPHPHLLLHPPSPSHPHPHPHPRPRPHHLLLRTPTTYAHERPRGRRRSAIPGSAGVGRC
ncbi:hypothetical protein HYPSUDRAFT_685843 [Hypholoma sublateritium FD-334 SS-4]|uniref:Uncharacterized protein n=1 Tax=Hypholoma sublateritium (strain FD-334 SS-4) TaxID=945553 RepID=A0A0D2L4B3_HYPSF|nr:hypothetical protein HYPSUDRAFT_685843 [Hypholoma sublateritium FD-334 SS-4]